MRACACALGKYGGASVLEAALPGVELSFALSVLARDLRPPVSYLPSVRHYREDVCCSPRPGGLHVHFICRGPHLLLRTDEPCPHRSTIGGLVSHHASLHEPLPVESRERPPRPPACLDRALPARRHSPPSSLGTGSRVREDTRRRVRRLRIPAGAHRGRRLRGDIVRRAPPIALPCRSCALRARLR